MFGSGSQMAPYNLKAPEGCGLQRRYSWEQEWGKAVVHFGWRDGQREGCIPIHG